jgi:hypothetical protein
MGTIRTTSGVLGIALLAAVMSGAGSQVAAGAAIEPEVLVAREAAWRAFYDGDVKALGEVLPEEFIGIGMNDAPFADRAKILDASRAFHERGGRLVRLVFPETQAMSSCSMGATRSCSSRVVRSTHGGGVSLRCSSDVTGSGCTRAGIST